MSELSKLTDQFRDRIRGVAYPPHIKKQGEFLLLALKQCGPGREAERKVALYQLDKFTAALKAA